MCVPVSSDLCSVLQLNCLKEVPRLLCSWLPCAPWQKTRPYQTMQTAEDRLGCLRQDGRDLVEYVEEFLELYNQVTWIDASLGVVISCDLPTCSFSLIELVNHVLNVNGVNFEVEIIPSDHHPIPPENHQASRAYPSPGPSTYPAKCSDHPNLPSTASVLRPEPPVTLLSQPPLAANASLRAVALPSAPETLSFPSALLCLLQDSTLLCRLQDSALLWLLQFSSSCGRSSQALSCFSAGPVQLSVVPAGPVQLCAARAPPRVCAARAPPRVCAARAPPRVCAARAPPRCCASRAPSSAGSSPASSSASSVQLSRAPAGPVQLSRAPAGPVQLSRAPVGSVRLSRAPVGSVRLSRAPAGSVRLPRAPAGSVWLPRAPAGSVRLPRAPSDNASRAPPNVCASWAPPGVEEFPQ